MTESNPVFGIERRGFDHIPEAERTMTLRETAYFWVGTNANLFFVEVGVIAFGLGLSVWQALVAVVLGTLLFAIVALASIGGVRAGLPTMTFTRAVFGPRGNLPHAVLAWVTSVAFEAINCIFGVFALLALMSYVGWDHPGDAGKVLATLLVLGASAVIADLRPRHDGLRAARLRGRIDARPRRRARLLRRRSGVVRAGARSPDGLGDRRRHSRGGRRGRVRPDLLPVQWSRLGPLPPEPDLGPQHLLDRVPQQRRDRPVPLGDGRAPGFAGGYVRSGRRREH